MNALPRPCPVPVPSLCYPPPNDTQIGRLLDKRFLQSPVQYWATYPGCMTITQHPLLFVTSDNPSQLNPNFPLPDVSSCSRYDESKCWSPSSDIVARLAFDRDSECVNLVTGLPTARAMSLNEPLLRIKCMSSMILSCGSDRIVVNKESSKSL